MDIYLLHPIINHFTIALISVSVLLDILGAITKNEKLHTAAWINLIIGAFAGVFTFVTGLIAEANVAHSGEAHEIMETHETIGFFILGIVAVLFVWRLFLKGRFPMKAGFLYIVLGLVGTGLIFLNGFYGGEMVFKHGVAVEAVEMTDQHAHGQEGHEHSGEHEHSGNQHENDRK